MDLLLQLIVCVLMASTLNAKGSDEHRNTTHIPSDHESAEAKPAATPAILPNVKFVGIGYDPILGNPHNDQLDPGFKDAVIQLEYNRGELTDDGKWRVPDRVQVLRAFSCSYASQSEEVMGSSGYQKSLSADASFSGGVDFVVKVKFTASSKYKEVYESTSKNKRILTSSVCKCMLYRANINYNYEAYNVTAAFASAVNSLPTTRDDAAYITLINTYGTHFTTTLTSGAKAIITSEFESSKWTRLDSEEFNFRAGADASFYVFAASAAAATDKQRRLQETFDSARFSEKVAYVGSHPPTDGKWETWASMVEEDPHPIQYAFAPLTDLLTAKYFPAVNQTELAARRDLLNATVTVYCEGLPGCGIPPPDRVPVRMKRKNTTFIGTQPLSCDPGFSLLSCGLGKRTIGSTDDPVDFNRYSIPVDNTSCECKDSSGGECSQWCSNSATGVTIAVSGPETGVFDVICPTGTKVIGCHIQPNTVQEVWQWNYPLADGTGCTCYDSFGAKCYATCASNVINHEVQHKYGRGLVTVKCSDTNYVLGCGIKPEAGGAVEKWRYHQVSSIDSCECYDNGRGATCYALCGCRLMLNTAREVRPWNLWTKEESTGCDPLPVLSAASSFPPFCTEFVFRQVMLWVAFAVVAAADYC